jgi:hypothetical protein
MNKVKIVQKRQKKAKNRENYRYPAADSPAARFARPRRAGIARKPGFGILAVPLEGRQKKNIMRDISGAVFSQNL